MFRFSDFTKKSAYMLLFCYTHFSRWSSLRGASRGDQIFDVWRLCAPHSLKHQEVAGLHPRGCGPATCWCFREWGAHRLEPGDADPRSPTIFNDLPWPPSGSSVCLSVCLPVCIPLSLSLGASVCVCLCVCVCVCACRACACARKRAHVCVNLRVGMRVRVRVSVRLSVCLSVSVCVSTPNWATKLQNLAKFGQIKPNLAQPWPT